MESHVTLFRPIENPRRLNSCSWDYRWLQGTGIEPSENIANIVKDRCNIPRAINRKRGGISRK